MTWLKICGITSAEDALTCAEAGADALGFVFAESPRRVTPERAAEIVGTLNGNLEKVGVFVNERAERIAAIAHAAGLTAAQMHGEEEAQTISSLRASTPELALFKAVSAADYSGVRAALPDTKTCSFLRAIFLDSGRRGGTGARFDWKAAQPAIAEFAERANVVICGGLTPENVGEAIQLFHPWGVDVSTGVERAPGKKDVAKVKAFIRAVRQAERKP